MIEATSCGGVVIHQGKILALYKSYRNRYEGWVLPKGTVEKGETFDLDLYSAVYDTSGEIIQYEKITYPNCTGQPFGVGAQDDTFYVGSITIDSAPAKGQAPYSINAVFALPAVDDVTRRVVDSGI